MSRVLTGVFSILLVTLVLVKTFMPLPPSSEADFFPLALHNSWTHLVTFSGSDYLYYMTETVIKDNLTLPDGNSYVVAEKYEPLTTTAPEASSTVAYFRKDGFLHRYPWLDSDGNNVWDNKLGQGTELILPSPYVGDTTWQGTLENNAFPMSGRQHTSSLATAQIEPEEVRVPAGVFHNCLRVETVIADQFLHPRTKKLTTFELHHTEWYAPGVGLVRAISDEGEGTPIKSVTELVWYNVQK
jgi:hypothetical protein